MNTGLGLPYPQSRNPAFLPIVLNLKCMKDNILTGKYIFEASKKLFEKFENMQRVNNVV